MKIPMMLACSVFAAGSLVSCGTGPEATAPAERRGVWIDVRSPREYASGHIAGAINLPHDEIRRRISTSVPDKDAEIHLYCRSGRRSTLAKQTLVSMGYSNVSNEGGYEKLKAR